MEIVLSKQAHKMLQKIDIKTKQRIIKGFNGLLYKPQQGNIKLLQGVENIYRLRIANCRILYENHIECVHIIKIAPRGEVYKQL